MGISVLIFPPFSGGDLRAMNDQICTEAAPLKVGEAFVRYQIHSLIGHGDHAPMNNKRRPE